MSKARLIITAVVVEGRSQAAVAREYGVSKGWVSKLVARYRAEGDAAFEPRSRRPHTRPDATPAATVELILELRRRLATQGLDAGADTIGWHLEPAATVAELQAQLDAFVDTYNHHRPHRSLDRRTPAAVYTTRPKASPGNHQPDTEHRVRTDRIRDGRVSLRVDGHMHHIGLGRTLDGTRIIMLIAGYDIRVIHHTTGEIIRTLTINPERRYHGTGRPPGGPEGPRKPQRSGP